MQTVTSMLTESTRIIDGCLLNPEPDHSVRSARFGHTGVTIIWGDCAIAVICNHRTLCRSGVADTQGASTADGGENSSVQEAQRGAHPFRTVKNNAAGGTGCAVAAHRVPLGGARPEGLR